MGHSWLSNLFRCTLGHQTIVTFRDQVRRDILLLDVHRRCSPSMRWHIQSTHAGHRNSRDQRLRIRGRGSDEGHSIWANNRPITRRTAHRGKIGMQTWLQASRGRAPNEIWIKPDPPLHRWGSQTMTFVPA